MIASPLFGPQLLLILLDKMGSDKKSSRLDSMDILAVALDRLSFDAISNYYMSFLDRFLMEVIFGSHFNQGIMHISGEKSRSRKPESCIDLFGSPLKGF